MSRLIVKNLPNGVSNPSGCQQPVPAAFRLSPLVNVTVCVCVVCRWRRRGSGPCSLPSAPWRTALWSSQRTASSESSALWVLKPRTTLTEPWNTSTRASWTRPEWRYGSSHGFTQVLYKVFVSMYENLVVIHRRWRCVRRLETQLRRKPGANTPRAPARTNPPLLQTLTAKRYLNTHTNWQGRDVTKYFYSGTNSSLCTLLEYFSVLIQHTQDFFLSEQCCEVLLHCHLLKMLHMSFSFLSSEKETDKGNQQLAWKCEYICMTCVKPK